MLPQPTASVLPPATAEYQHAVDSLERAMLAVPEHLVDLPLRHVFTHGLYVRQIFMPAGTLCTSRIHRTQHPYVVVAGRVSVFIPGTEASDGQPTVEHITAPHFGVTEPGTRRVLYMHEDTVWMTFHPNPDDTHDLELIESRVIEQRELDDGHTAYELYAEALRTFQLDEQDGADLQPQLDYGGAP